jgi:sphingomyelin phosphodiesterase acid-like 3
MRRSLSALALLLAALHAPAQPTAGPATIPALFISDIHYDPLRNPALAPRLNSAPASEWPAILASPATPALAEDYAAVEKACPTRGNDPDQALWQSTLAALRARAANSRFILLSGDLLPHNFECRYQFLFPKSAHDQYLNFTLKTLRYVIASLRNTLPGVPIYVALGNNDSACKGNSLDPNNDFLALTARVIADTLPSAARPSVLHDVATGGYYSVLMAPPMLRTRIIVVDNLFFLHELTTCDGRKDYTEEAAQTHWLNRQLVVARRHHERVWLLGHIPPGVSLYTTFLHNTKICDGQPPFMSQDTEGIARALSANGDIVRLAVFAHTHSDALALLTPTLGDSGPAPPHSVLGVPVKIVASVSAINGNNPSFTLAQVDPVTATLRDYTIIQSSNLTGIGASWTPVSHYNPDYSEPDFSARSLKDLIARFRADPNADTPASQAYIHAHYSSELKTAERAAGWPISVCQMDHDTGASFAACACASGGMPTQP